MKEMLEVVARLGEVRKAIQSLDVYQSALVYSTNPERGMISAQSLASFCCSRKKR